MLKLKEKQTYSFKILKVAELPPDNSKQYILKGPNGRRYMLPYRVYESYGLRLNSTVNCRVDKINCSGKIFIEPEHPYYKLGFSYDFDFKEIKEVKETQIEKHGYKLDVSYYQLIVGDVFGRTHTVEPFPWQINSDYSPRQVRCRLLRITNGAFHLKNEDIRHPYYIIGKVYKFKFVRIKYTQDSDDRYLAKVILRGGDGHEHSAPALMSQLQPNFRDKTLKCRVEDIVDGKLVLTQVF